VPPSWKDVALAADPTHGISQMSIFFQSLAALDVSQNRTEIDFFYTYRRRGGHETLDRLSLASLGG
jgi:hypothetical protein